MKKALFIILNLLPAILYGQLPWFGKAEPDGSPDIYYYRFYNGIQMIEFDYLSAYHRKVNYLEQAQPRALTWEMVLGPPFPNVYLFRDEHGKIVKQFGAAPVEQLLSVEKSLKVAISHNSLAAQIGSVFGFSQIRTRYFPYYLIGTTPHIFNEASGNLGLIDSLGNKVLPEEYSLIMRNNNIFITRKGVINELRDRNLKIRFTSHEFRLQPAQFHNGCADILKDDKCGLMDSTGKIIVPCEYDMLISHFNEAGLAQVIKSGRVGFVNIEGKEVIKCKYQSAYYCNGGLILARNEEKWGYIDAKGKIIIPHKYDIVGCFEEGLVRVAKKVGSQYFFGFIDKEENVVIPLSYSDARDFKDGTAKVMYDGKWIKIDKNGNKVK